MTTDTELPANPDADLEDEDDELGEDIYDEEEEGGLAPAKNPDFDSEEKLRIAATAADSLRASDILALDLRGLTIIADFFLVCTGNSSIQIRSIADRIEERLRERGLKKLRVEGYQEATWILMDYGDLVAHVMAAEQRAYYRLEDFWKDAPRVELDLSPEPPATPSAS